MNIMIMGIFLLGFSVYYAVARQERNLRSDIKAMLFMFASLIVFEIGCVHLMFTSVIGIIVFVVVYVPCCCKVVKTICKGIYNYLFDL